MFSLISDQLLPVFGGLRQIAAKQVYPLVGSFFFSQGRPESQNETQCQRSWETFCRLDFWVESLRVSITMGSMKKHGLMCQTTGLVEAQWRNFVTIGNMLLYVVAAP